VTLPHRLLEGALRVRALDYAAGLYPGATVNEYDRAYCALFLAYLPEALARHGLRLNGATVERIELREAAE
jgi:hypothetical protein